MVCVNSLEGATHVTYYANQGDPGVRPALGAIHLYEGEMLSFHTSGHETRRAGNSEYTVYKLNVKFRTPQGFERKVVYKRWSQVAALHRELSKEFKERVGWTVSLPKKYSSTKDTGRLQKRERQLNHYFAELTGLANRENLDLCKSDAMEKFLHGPSSGGSASIDSSIRASLDAGSTPNSETQLLSALAGRFASEDLASGIPDFSSNGTGKTTYTFGTEVAMSRISAELFGYW